MCRCCRTKPSSPTSAESRVRFPASLRHADWFDAAADADGESPDRDDITTASKAADYGAAGLVTDLDAEAITDAMSSIRG